MKYPPTPRDSACQSLWFILFLPIFPLTKQPIFSDSQILIFVRFRMDSKSDYAILTENVKSISTRFNKGRRQRL